ncbi:MAG: hypothetical protein QNJ22_23820 [Desulfosarcinaceae bacterium]|nr:hypothetical protein [Desulfosarcinaceae bacterium]
MIFAALHRSWSIGLGLLWLSVLLIIWGCGGSGGGSDGNPAPRADSNIPEGSAGITANVVSAPGATVLVAGERHTDQAPISAQTPLVGILKDDQVYLYHPQLGTSTLSAENSRLAVLYFMLQDTGIAPSQPALVHRTLSVRPGAGPSHSRTGLAIEQSVRGGRITVQNQSKIWGAVKSDLGRIHYLKPRDNAISTNVIDLYERLLNGSIWSYQTRSDVVADHQMDTFSAYWRGNAAYYWTGTPQHVLDARASDPDLSTNLNMLDMVDLLLTGVHSLLGLVPSKCFDAVVGDSAINALRAIVMQELTGESDDDSAAAAQEWDMVKDTMQGLVNCMADASPLKAHVDAVNEFLDALAFLSYTLESYYLGIYQSLFTLEAYEMVVLEESDVTLRNGTIGTLGPLSVDEDGEVTIGCQAQNAAVVYADLSALGGDANAELISSGPDPEEWQWDNWSGRFHVRPPSAGEIPVYLAAHSSGGDRAWRDLKITVHTSVCAEEEHCNNTVDDDCDNFVDCDDPDCFLEEVCDPCLDEEICDDGRDNDCNVFVDCEDPGCDSDPACEPICLSEDGRDELCRQHNCDIPEITAPVCWSGDGRHTMCRNMGCPADQGCYWEETIIQEYVPCYWQTP